MSVYTVYEDQNECYVDDQNFAAHPQFLKYIGSDSLHGVSVLAWYATLAQINEYGAGPFSSKRQTVTASPGSIVPVDPWIGGAILYAEPSLWQAVSSITG